MKKFISTAVMAALAISASAQLASDMSMSETDAPGSYNLLGVSYDNTNLSGKNFEFNDKKSMGLNGFAVEYIHGFGLSSTNPMYLELGAKFNMGFGSNTDEGYELKMQMMRLSVPVSYAWRFGLGDGMALTPYAGIDFRFNVLGRVNEIEPNGDESGWNSVFSKDDMGEDDTWNRFQLGWHVGARFEYSRVFLGVSYGTDFIKAFKYDEEGEKCHVTTGNLAVTVGYRF